MRKMKARVSRNENVAERVLRSRATLRSARRLASDHAALFIRCSGKLISLAAPTVNRLQNIIASSVQLLPGINAPFLTFASECI